MCPHSVVKHLETLGWSRISFGVTDWGIQTVGLPEEVEVRCPSDKSGFVASQLGKSVDIP